MTSLILLKAMLFAKAVQKSKKHKKEDKSCIEDSDLKNMCRICCSENGKIAIFNNKKYPNMPKDITQFSGVDVCKNDNFPQHICHGCLKLLNGCIKFKYICNLSHKRLSEISPKQEAIEIVNVNVIPNETEESYNVPSPSFPDDNMENWTCTTCNKEFQDCYTYNDHLSECMAILDAKKKQNAEINKKAFLCDICGKATTSNAGLRIHKTIHEHVFPHKCDQCPYRGKTANLLRIHKRSHLVDKPYKCTQCPKATSTSSNLAKHMRLAHTTERSHKCTYCEKAFFYKHDVTRHISEVHLRQGIVECDICFKKFNTKHLLQRHTRKIHKIKSERHGRLPSYLHCTGETN
ncbi:zinc finger protein 675-like [Aricia agestis]|uniref:zinc finger protein 675-like n=1 Tax=Aricia agestis TaxID=91739 RepID=UPI001C20C36B|nr:zinc finger protein 675-like [Aricia agestis]